MLSDKENFLGMFQCNVNHILGVDEARLFEITDIEFLSVNNGRFLCNEEGLSFLAGSHARNCVNAGVIKLNSDRSEATVDLESAIGSNGNEKVKLCLTNAQY
ncbi:hypothetical protein OTSUT76_0248 [Orientia tsutsugamushi str. UT76]|nr:hypothetical protein OTSUT76_0248 [Orientia tsutsugamushi str. UT76]